MHEIEVVAVDSPHPPIAEQARQYLATDGADIDHPYADRVILLYVTGRATGVVRRVPLVSVADGDDLIIVASKGGAPDHPAWYRNLEADRRVWVRNKADFYEAEAIILDGADRSEAWAKMVDAMSFFDGYEKKTDRVIPVIRLRHTG